MRCDWDSGRAYLWVSWASDPEWVRRLTGTTGSELRLRLRLDCVAMVDIRAEGSTPGAGSRRLRLRLHVPLPVSVGDSAGGVRKLDFDCASTGFETCGLGAWNRRGLQPWGECGIGTPQRGAQLSARSSRTQAALVSPQVPGWQLASGRASESPAALV